MRRECLFLKYSFPRLKVSVFETFPREFDILPGHHRGHHELLLVDVPGLELDLGEAEHGGVEGAEVGAQGHRQPGLDLVVNFDDVSDKVDNFLKCPPALGLGSINIHCSVHELLFEFHDEIIVGMKTLLH